jgi:hypothetical protein
MRESFHRLYRQCRGVRSFILQDVKPILNVKPVAYLDEARVGVALDFCPYMVLSVRKRVRTEA